MEKYSGKEKPRDLSQNQAPYYHPHQAINCI